MHGQVVAVSQRCAHSLSHHTPHFIDESRTIAADLL
eukprot:COSAG05_NODE_2552_length_2912_cov_3.527551_1_plen_35_part_10